MRSFLLFLVLAAAAAGAYLLFRNGSNGAAPRVDAAVLRDDGDPHPHATELAQAPDEGAVDAKAPPAPAVVPEPSGRPAIEPRPTAVEPGGLPAPAQELPLEEAPIPVPRTPLVERADAKATEIMEELGWEADDPRAAALGRWVIDQMDAEEDELGQYAEDDMRRYYSSQWNDALEERLQELVRFAGADAAESIVRILPARFISPQSGKLVPAEDFGWKP